MRWAALALLFVLAPAATASFSMTGTPPDHSIIPGKEAADVPITVSVDCASLLEAGYNPAYNGIANVGMTFTAPAGIVVSGPGNVPLSVARCSDPTATVTKTTAYVLSASRTVPGLVALAATARAHIDAAGGFTAIPDAIWGLHFSVGYYGLVSVIVDDKGVDVAPGSSAHFQLRLANFSNADTMVAVSSTDTWDRAWIEVPDSILLRVGANTTARVTVNAVPASGLVNEPMAFRLKIDPFAATSPDHHAPPLNVTVLVHVRSSILPAHGAPAPAAVTLLLVALVASGLRRLSAS